MVVYSAAVVVEVLCKLETMLVEILGEEKGEGQHHTLNKPHHGPLNSLIASIAYTIYI